MQVTLHTDWNTRTWESTSGPHNRSFLSIYMHINLSHIIHTHTLIIICSSHVRIWVILSITLFAYKMQPTYTSPTQHPSLDSCNLCIIQSTYTQNRIGDKTPPCLTPQNSWKQYEVNAPHLTYAVLYVYHIISYYSLLRRPLQDSGRDMELH